MFANRFTVVADACVLVSALKRNLLLSFAEAELFRVRWSQPILDEAEAAIAHILEGKGVPDARARGRRARDAMEAAFEEADVGDVSPVLPSVPNLSDPDDRHVVAAALQARASLVVTDNLNDFPTEALRPLGLEARSCDDFLADTISLDEGLAVAATQRLRQRLKRPQLDGGGFLLRMEAVGLIQSADLLRPYIRSI